MYAAVIGNWATFDGAILWFSIYHHSDSKWFWCWCDRNDTGEDLQVERCVSYWAGPRYMMEGAPGSQCFCLSTKLDMWSQWGLASDQSLRVNLNLEQVQVLITLANTVTLSTKLRIQIRNSKVTDINDCDMWFLWTWGSMVKISNSCANRNREVYLTQLAFWVLHLHNPSSTLFVVLTRIAICPILCDSSTLNCHGRWLLKVMMPSAPREDHIFHDLLKLCRGRRAWEL